LDPGNTKCLRYRGDTYKNLKEYDLAISDYDKAIGIDPNDSIAFLSRGDTYYARGNYPRAVPDYKRSIELNPTGKAYYYLGDAYLNSAQYDLALENYNRAIDLDPDLEYVRQYRGDAEMFKGMYDKALEDYQRVMEINPDDWHGFAYVAEIYVMTRDAENAKSALKNTLDKFDADLPDDEKGALKIISDSLENTGQFPDPVSLVTEVNSSMEDSDLDRADNYAYAAFVMSPQSPQVNYLLASVFDKLDFNSSAIRFYGRYLLLSPDTTKREEILKRITELIK